MLELQLLVSEFIQAADAMSKLASSVQSLVCCAQDVGDEPYQASVMKITGNFFIVSCVETIAEGMTLAEKNGISRCIEIEISPDQASCCLVRASCCKSAILLQIWAMSSRLRCCRLVLCLKLCIWHQRFWLCLKLLVHTPAC